MAKSYKLGSDKLLENFYDYSTVYVPNKYSVILYGPAVTNAVEVMRRSAGQSGEYVDVDKESFQRWEHYHYQHDDSETYSGYPFINSKLISQGSVHLKWACSDVRIPSLDSQAAEESVVMDTFKDLKYHIIGNYDANGILSMGITEERGLMWYQFFNALANQFYNAKALIPRDSLHKLSAKVIPLITTEDGSPSSSIEYEKAQLFEFNSIIYNGMGKSLKLSNASDDPLKYTVSFTCPNTFQSSLKKQAAGMQNRFNDDNYIITNDRKERNMKKRGSKFEDTGNILDIWD